MSSTEALEDFGCPAGASTHQLPSRRSGHKLHSPAPSYISGRPSPVSVCVVSLVTARTCLCQVLYATVPPSILDPLHLTVNACTGDVDYQDARSELAEGGASCFYVDRSSSFRATHRHSFGSVCSTL